MVEASGNLKSLENTGLLGEEMWMLKLWKSIREELDMNAESQLVLGVRGDGQHEDLQERWGHEFRRATML